MLSYLIAFLEGIITFISPCLLPMLPVYLLYFAGGSRPEVGAGEEPGAKRAALRRTVVNALGFVLGFTLVFVSMGAFAALLGSLLNEYRTWVNVVSGLIVIVFGLNFLGVFGEGIFRGHGGSRGEKPLRFFSSVVFGVVFSLAWTPCVGAFLGSALLLASQQESWLRGVLMLLCYSAGLGIPFLLSAVLLDRLKGAFAFIKRNYRVVNVICGCLLIAVGILMMTGLMSRLASALS